MLITVEEHYDRLIEIGNDPVFDSDILKEYMDKWDGREFLEELELNKNQSVLEIGVGTGRVALKTAGICKAFCGIDLSKKTCDRARINLSLFKNVRIIYGDFLTTPIFEKFDVIYSTLTFMHIENKTEALRKVYGLLSDKGRFILSVAKDMSEYIDMTDYKLKVFPSDKFQTEKLLKACGFIVQKTIEKDNAYIFVSIKKDFNSKC